MECSGYFGENENGYSHWYPTMEEVMKIKFIQEPQQVNVSDKPVKKSKAAKD